MEIFGISENKMKETSSIFTLAEIFQQPRTWMPTVEKIQAEREAIKAFLSKAVSHSDYDIILTGAGTSEFIGNTLYSYINRLMNYRVKSFATTDIVSAPENYLSRTKPTLLVSFGRSGNSPESVGAVEVANTVCENIYHLFITCNREGSLSKLAEKLDNCYAINLADETHDQSFAMTSSFSNMYLAAYLCFNIDSLDEKAGLVAKLAKSAEKFLTSGYTTAKNIVDTYNFERIVYLGSNTLKGVAQESSLKMLELTAGRVIPMYDTPLGFRHGPKSIIDDSTLTVVYVSDDEFTFKYELDLIKEISSQRKGNKLLIVSNRHSQELESLADFYYAYEVDARCDNIELGLTYITLAQTIAVLKSLSMNITPDNPCPSGEVNRVVKGVTIYDYK